jgi:hypothetical protein
MSDQPSPLGRYDEPTAAAEPLHEVRLIGLPLRVYAAARQHHDDLVQELSVLAVSLEEAGTEAPPRLSELVEVLGRRYGRPSSRPDAVVDEALARGDSTIDVTHQVPAHVIQAAARLEGLMAEADQLSRSGQLLTMPRSDSLVRFSHWYLDEFRRQINGQQPQPWTGPADLSPT